MNGNTVTADGEFEQAFGAFTMWRGFGQDPLFLHTFEEGWKTASQSNGVDGDGAMGVVGTKGVPPSDHAEFFQSRLLVPYKEAGRADQVAVGDIGDYTRFKYPQNSFRINQGDSFDIVKVQKFGLTSVVFFKGQNILYVTNLIPDAAGDYSGAYMDELTDRHGLMARNSVVAVGKDLYYLSTEQGITSVQLTEENNLRPGVEHLSKPMEKTLERVNWGQAGNCQAATWDDYLFFAVPLDEAWILGDDVVAAQALVYSGGTPSTVTVTGLTIGQKYYYEPTSIEFSLTDGSDVYLGALEFVAQGTSVTLRTLAGSTPACAATIKPVEHENVNNGVLVFDLVNKAWAGVDEAEGVIAVKRWMTLTWQGRERLFYLSNDGFVRLYQDGFADEKLETGLTPYADLVIYKMPGSGDTLRVNSGTLIQATPGTGFNGATTWYYETLGIVSPGFAAYTLWNWGYGYDPGEADVWTSPNATASQILSGVRFTSTDGSTPSLAVSGDFTLWDVHGPSEIRPQEIETVVISRGYLSTDLDHKRWQSLDLVMDTWAPSLTVQTLTDGIGEEHTEIDALTFDRLKWHTVVADYDPTNADDNHGSSYRKDYSIVIPDTGFYLGVAGVVLAKHQSVQKAVRLDNHRGRSIRVKITNTAGRVVIRQIDLLAVTGNRRKAERV
jgi:hypothetical protein